MPYFTGMAYLNQINLLFIQMHLYFDLIEKIPAFKTYDTFGEDYYIEIGNSPPGFNRFLVKRFIG